MKLPKWLHRVYLFGPARRLRVVERDSLPAKMPLRDLVMTKDDGDAWSVGMLCPCRCGSTIELLVIAGAKPRWEVDLDKRGAPASSLQSGGRPAVGPIFGFGMDEFSGANDIGATNSTRFRSLGNILGMILLRCLDDRQIEPPTTGHPERQLWASLRHQNRLLRLSWRTAAPIRGRRSAHRLVRS